MLKVGIVGLPNVGKSTLFNAVLKRQQALSANYPFATIEPNVGIVDVVDKRLGEVRRVLFESELAKLGKKIEDTPLVYANIEFVDIAGLVEGASKGEGLGNKFLANIREVDMILQVVRDFEDTEIIREHSKNPNDDTEIINSELIIKDIESVEKRIKSFGRDQSAKDEIALLTTYLEHLNGGKLAVDLNPLTNDSSVSKEHYLEFIKPLFLLTDKQMVYVFNVSETDERLKDREMSSRATSEAISEIATSNSSTSPVAKAMEDRRNDEYKDRKCIYISAKLESELSSLDEADQKQYLSDLGIAEAGLDKITKTCFEMLGLISFFTAGEMEVRAWEIKKGFNAVEASGAIHTDFMKSFIKAEVVGFNDYVELVGKIKAKEKGKLRLEGKEYIVKDADIIEFKIGA